jgi:uroporphyrinogen decarboxylase
MTRKELVLASLKHEQPPTCPYNLAFAIPAAAKLAAHYGDADFRHKLGGAIAMVLPTAPGAWVQVRPDFWRDEFGVVWDRSVDKDIGNPEPMLDDPSDLRPLKLPEPLDPRRFEHFDAFCRDHADCFIMGGIGFSLFERAWTLRGMENLLIDMVTEPAFVEGPLDRIVEWNLAVVDRMCDYPIDAVHLGDDWGRQQGLIMGPAHWRKFIKPRLKRMCDRIKSKGKFVSIRSCGDIRLVLPDLIDIGLDMFNPFQPEVMNVEAVKRKYGNHLTFHGGVSTQKTLPYGTPDEVRAEVRKRIATIGKDGGYVCAPAHDIPGDVPLENMLALVDELQNQKSP